MRILISNDDGHASPGIKALAEAMVRFGEVMVAAPEQDRSGASNSLTLDRPLTIKKSALGYWIINGTPTDCVHLALTGALDFTPDLVVSGINDGANLGDDTLYSGTVAAAMEGFQLGFSSIAFSMVQKGYAQLATGAKVACEVVETYRTYLLEQGPKLLNVNIPECSYSELKGLEVTRLGKRHPAQAAIEQVNHRGQKMYWLGPAGGHMDAGEGTDFYAIEQQRVSITPLGVDLTAHAQLNSLAQWLKP
jgi:5'-nucleotidase